VIRCPICGQDFTSEDEPCEKIRGKTVGECIKEEGDKE